MAQGKKISELTELSSVTDNDEFLFVDKEGSGANSGNGGSNVKIKFSDLKMAITDGMKGEPGMDAEKGQKGEVGDRGIDGGGAAYFDQSPSDGDSIYYMGSGNLGLGTDAPSAKLDVVGSGIASGSDLSKERVFSINRPSVGGVTYGQKVNFFLSKYEGTGTPGITTQARTRLDIALAHSNGEGGEVSDVDGTNERDGGTRVMTMTSDGKVAIGKTDKVNFPEATLDVYGRVHLGPLTTGTVNHRIRVGGGKTGDVDNGLSFVPGNAQTTDQFISFKTGSSVLVGAFGSVSDELLFRTRENATALKIAQNGNLDANGTIKSTGLNVQSTGTTINLHTTRSNMYSYVSLKNTTSSKDPILVGYHTSGDFNIARADGSYAKLRLWHDDSRMQLMSSTTLHDNGSVCIGGSAEKVRNAKFSVTQGDGLFAMIPEGYHGWPELKSLNESETANKPFSIGMNSRSPYIHDTGGYAHAHIGLGTVKPEHPFHIKHGDLWSSGLISASSLIPNATSLTSTAELDPNADNWANGLKIMVNGIEMTIASVNGTTINLDASTPYTGSESSMDMDLIFMKDSLMIKESGHLETGSTAMVQSRLTVNRKSNLAGEWNGSPSLYLRSDSSQSANPPEGSGHDQGIIFTSCQKGLTLQGDTLNVNENTHNPHLNIKRIQGNVGIGDYANGYGKLTIFGMGNGSGSDGVGLELNSNSNGCAIESYVREGVGIGDNEGVVGVKPLMFSASQFNFLNGTISSQVTSGFCNIFSKDNHSPAIKFKGQNSSVGLNYSMGIERRTDSSNYFHISRSDDADQILKNNICITQQDHVGINISSPEARLHVRGVHKISNEGDDNWAYMILEGHGTNSEGKGRLSISNYGNAGSGSIIDLQAGPLRIQMSPTGEYVEETGTVEKFRFHPEGGLSVNTTAISDKKLYVAGEAYTTVGWTGSDDRLKHNEVSIDNAVDLIGKLSPVKYIKTNEMYEANHNFELNQNNQPIDDKGEIIEHTVEAGVIAQELLKIPELKYIVSEGSTEEDGTETPHSVNYNSLLSIALKAIQELKAEIDALKNK
jgi:hypothetical protein